jgi:PAS domain S-box-containing protein
MVDDWGVTRHRRGKTVWFRLSHEDGASHEPTEPHTAGTVQANRRAASVPVELRNMPLLLHAAWQEHAEALLREYLLASMDSDGPDSIQMHAEAVDAIAVLEEHVPPAPVEMSSDDLMDDATEPYVSAARIEVPVPKSSVDHFETLDRAIEAALDLSREGLVLAAPTQPEVQVFRRWMCREVLRQARGGAPQPWSVPADEPDEPYMPPDWDPTTVTEAEGCVIAANEASQIIALSAGAAELLGYPDPSELVGNRIVAIIPERYRQAHVAGFTMYLLVGRKPLLRRPVRVPALRRDGSEVEIELVVHDEGAGNGRSVLLANLRATNG